MYFYEYGAFTLLNNEGMSPFKQSSYSDELFETGYLLEVVIIDEVRIISENKDSHIITFKAVMRYSERTKLRAEQKIV